MSSQESESLAERYAADVAATRARIEVDRQRMGEAKLREIEEQEAFALAQIRLRTEREAAQQAEALADAERRAERAAIERRSTELEAARLSRQKADAEQEALRLVDARLQALKDAEIARQSTHAAHAEALRLRQQRKAAGHALREARKTDLKQQIRYWWWRLGMTHPLLWVALALLLGLGLGAAWPGKNSLTNPLVAQPFPVAAGNTGGEGDGPGRAPSAASVQGAPAGGDKTPPLKLSTALSDGR